MICPILSRSNRDAEGNTTWDHHDCIEGSCTFWAQEITDCGLRASAALEPIKSAIEKVSSSTRETGLKLLEGVSALEEPLRATGRDLGLRLEALKEDIARLEEGIGTVRNALAPKEDIARLEEGIETVRKALAQKEDIARLEEGIETVRKALAQEAQRRGRDEAMALNARGVALYHRGAAEAAEAAFRSVIDLDPGFAEAHNNLGLALSRQGKDAEAEASFQKALELAPAMAEAMNNLGFLFHQNMQFEKAVEMFKRSALEAQDASVAYTNLGNACYRLGRYADAVDAWKKALERDPLNEPARNALKMFQQAGV